MHLMTGIFHLCAALLPLNIGKDIVRNMYTCHVAYKDGFSASRKLLVPLFTRVNFICWLCLVLELFKQVIGFDD